MDLYRVHIQGLSNTTHRFEYQFGDEFFRHYGTSLVEKGRFRAEVCLDKHETFIEVTFRLSGAVELVCDRSLDEFEYPMEISRKIIFKFGDQTREVDEQIQMITWGTDTLELGQFMYEFIGLEVPLKKLHPRYQSDNTPDGIIYSTGTEDTDPRWNILKQIKDN
ncbi:MAG: DNA-binding protein [Cyclobacteriaceae bacterium]|nr:MAG: DNA-binding protein [Cyclobacteriaceae bacterium]